MYYLTIVSRGLSRESTCRNTTRIEGVESMYSTITYVSSGFHNSLGSSHLSFIALRMAKVLVGTMIIEAAKKFGHHTQPWHIVLQMVFFICKFKQFAIIKKIKYIFTTILIAIKMQ